MTQRERQASGGVYDAPPKEVRAADRRPPGPAAPTGFPLWEDLFRGASPAQQKELLALAERQGVVYAHQFPSPTAAPVPSDAARALLTRLLAGQLDTLEPLRPKPAPVGAVPLDDAQRDAVARALETPDVCLIQGAPGTGKSRVVAEIVARAAARGERVLLLAPGAAALDRVLDAVGTRDLVCAIRCLGRDEKAESLPPSLRALTFAERARSFKEHSLDCARREVGRAEERLARRREEENLWGRFDELAAAQEALTTQLDALTQKRSQIALVVEAAAQAAERGDAAAGLDAVAAAFRSRDEARRNLETRLAELRGNAEARRREQEALQGQLHDLRPLLEAKQQKRWWTGSWWWATIQGNVPEKARDLQERAEALGKELATAEETVARAGVELAHAQESYRAERTRLIDAEVARRQSELDEQEAVQARERRLLQEKWQALCQQLDADTPRPTAPTNEAIVAARAEWTRLRSGDEERLAFARQWADCLHEAADTLPSRLLAYVNVVAATVGGLSADEHFGDAAAKNVSFDLLIVERAHEVTEAEFLAAARRARRWVLVGEPTRPEAPAPETPRGAPRRPTRPAHLRPGFFQKLWDRLHCDPQTLPYEWRYEGDRLCCRLRLLSDAERRGLMREPVADRPDIELRIVDSGGEPQLAEIVFPGTTPIAEAKSYVFRELSELPVAPCCRTSAWVEEGDRLVLRFGDEPPADAVAVSLADGVREIVGALRPEGPDGSAWRTCRLEFDRGAGWDWDKAEAWTAKHLSLRHLGRTARLTTPHRMTPALALFVADLLGDDAYVFCPPPGRFAPAVDFIAVPPLPPARGDRRGGRGRREVPRTGAGLEQELADSRHGDRLPNDVRGALPPRGLVNYMEALAVVRALEGLAQEMPADAAPKPVAVVALTAAQAALIRLLVGRSTPLATGRLTLTVDTPIAFVEQEYPVAVLSLTRSHTHRAVTLGDDPRLVDLALTRGRERLIVVGDPGTLARRAQWEATVDHLDEAASARERRFAIALVEYLHGRGHCQSTFHLREGGSP